MIAQLHVSFSDIDSSLPLLQLQLHYRLLLLDFSLITKKTGKDGTSYFLSNKHQEMDVRKGNYSSDVHLEGGKDYRETNIICDHGHHGGDEKMPDSLLRKPLRNKRHSITKDIICDYICHCGDKGVKVPRVH